MFMLMLLIRLRYIFLILTFKWINFPIKHGYFNSWIWFLKLIPQMIIFTYIATISLTLIILHWIMFKKSAEWSLLLRWAISNVRDFPYIELLPGFIICNSGQVKRITVHIITLTNLCLAIMININCLLSIEIISCISNAFIICIQILKIFIAALLFGLIMH